MPTATVTVREVKNTDSGLDLSIPSHKESPGLFQTVVEYNVVCVSALACFKSPKHKETDVVQFMIPKKNEDFEKLKKDLETKFSGTMFPPIPKSVLGITIIESSVTERRAALEHFVKFIARVPKLATCHISLQFLGVNAITAGKFSSGQPVAQTGPPFKAGDGGKDIFEEAREEANDQTTQTLFGAIDDLDAEEEALFRPSPKKTVVATAAFLEYQDDVDKTNRLFENQDFGDAIKDGEEHLFFVPGAKEKNSKQKIQIEDNTEILTVEDDLDKLLNLDTSSKQDDQSSEQPTPVRKSTGVTSTSLSLFEEEKKPSLFDEDDIDEQELFGSKPIKPTKPDRPEQMSKPPKPAKPVKPVKPTLAPKPGLKPKPGAILQSAESVRKAAEEKIPPMDNGSTQLGADDILQYIQSNETKDDDVDLFS